MPARERQALMAKLQAIANDPFVHRPAASALEGAEGFGFATATGVRYIE
jgi:hypothetical protein